MVQPKFVAGRLYQMPRRSAGIGFRITTEVQSITAGTVCSVSAVTVSESEGDYAFGPSPAA